MALQKGEKYRCPDSNCGCEIEVTKGAKPGEGVMSTRAVVAARKC